MESKIFYPFWTDQNNVSSMNTEWIKIMKEKPW